MTLFNELIIREFPYYDGTVRTVIVEEDTSTALHIIWSRRNNIEK